MQDKISISKEYKELILNASGDGVYGVDTRGRTIFANPAAEQMIGYSAKELLGKGMHALIHHSHADGRKFPGLECPIYAAFKDGRVHRVSDEVFWRKDGTCFPVEYVSTPIIDDGKIVGAVISFRDVTLQKEAEKALIESEERYRRIVEATHDVTFLVDAKTGMILDMTDEACELLGFSREELLTKSVADLHPHELGELSKFLTSILAEGRSGTDRLSWVSATGHRIPIHISASVVTIQGMTRILAMVQNRTDFHEAEMRAQKLQADLLHGARVGAMGELASGLAHELNQPLTAIMNYIKAGQMVSEKSDQPPNEMLMECLEKASEQADRAGKIISGLRSFIKKGDGRRSIENLNDIADEASHLLISKAHTKNIEFSSNLSAELPRVLVDKIQIQQVVFNLVRNAIEALGTVDNNQLTLTTALVRSDAVREVRVRVEDNGPGVNSDALGQLFEAFSSTKSEGLGVGLSICKTIVEDHGGRIWADRRESGGMCFTFTLPIPETGVEGD